MDDLIKEAYLSRLEDCLPVDFSDGVKFGVGLCKDKKYTEVDLRNAYEHGSYSIIDNGHGDTFDEYINSLNKQD